MKALWRIAIALLLASALILSIGCAVRGTNEVPAASPAQLSYIPPEPEIWKLPNGLTVMFLRDGELPLARGFLMLKGGALWEQKGELGLYGAMGSQLRNGGAGGLGADALDRRLESLAAGISSSVGDESGSVDFSCLTSDFDTVFGLFADVALRPRFEEQRLELWRAGALDSIRRRRDDTSTVAAIAYEQLIFGDTAFGRVTSSADIQRIDRSSLQRAHRFLMQPEGAILGISGDVDPERVQAAVEREFGKWSATRGPLGPPPELNFEPKPGIYFIELPFKQATVLMGHQGVERLSPDYPAIELFNQIFGSSGFGSRLVTRVREELGLSYGVYGAVGAGVVRGKNMIYLQTKGASAGEAIGESMLVLSQLQSEPVGALELDNVKQRVANEFVFKFDVPHEIVSRRALLQAFKYPLDYDARYLERINAVRAAEVTEVASRRWNLGQFVIVVVGDETAYNSVASAVAALPGLLGKLPFQRVRFGEKLEI